MELSSKPPKTSTNSKLAKLYEFKHPKHRRTSTINLQKGKVHEEQEEHEEQRIFYKLIARDSL